MHSIPTFASRRAPALSLTLPWSSQRWSGLWRLRRRSASGRTIGRAKRSSYRREGPGRRYDAGHPNNDPRLPRADDPLRHRSLRAGAWRGGCSRRSALIRRFMILESRIVGYFHSCGKAPVNVAQGICPHGAKGPAPGVPGWFPFDYQPDLLVVARQRDRASIDRTLGRASKPIVIGQDFAPAASRSRSALAAAADDVGF